MNILKLKTLTLILSMSLILVINACSNFDMKTKEESKNDIIKYNNELQIIDKKINETLSKSINSKYQNEFNIIIKDKFLNNVSNLISNHRDDDIKFFILPKKSFFSETKKVLGLEYNNYVNIDTGYISLNLKKIYFSKLTNNKVYGEVEIEGGGNFRISGKHTGVPGIFSPDINLYLREDIVFNIKLDNNNLVLTPENKDLELITKFTISFLQFKLPYSQSFVLKTKDLIKPIRLPLLFQNYVNLPKPEDKINSKRLVYDTYKLYMDDIKIRANDGILEYNSNVTLQKK